MKRCSHSLALLFTIFVIASLRSRSFAFDVEIAPGVSININGQSVLCKSGNLFPSEKFLTLPDKDLLEFAKIKGAIGKCNIQKVNYSHATWYEFSIEGRTVQNDPDWVSKLNLLRSAITTGLCDK
jgi:hypothetical protein